jgi:hypothetical protein
MRIEFKINLKHKLNELREQKSVERGMKIFSFHRVTNYKSFPAHFRLFLSHSFFIDVNRQANRSRMEDEEKAN